MTTLARNAEAILSDLDAADVTITLDGPDLILKPRERLSAGLVDRLKSSKDAVIRLVIHRRILAIVAGWQDEAWREYFLERSGMVEDGNVSRDHADKAAFHQAIAFVLEGYGFVYRPGSIPTPTLLWIRRAAATPKRRSEHHEKA